MSDGAHNTYAPPIISCEGRRGGRGGRVITHGDNVTSSLWDGEGDTWEKGWRANGFVVDSAELMILELPELLGSWGAPSLPSTGWVTTLLPFIVSVAQQELLTSDLTFRLVVEYACSFLSLRRQFCPNTMLPLTYIFFLIHCKFVRLLFCYSIVYYSIVYNYIAMLMLLVF